MAFLTASNPPSDVTVSGDKDNTWHCLDFLCRLIYLEGGTHLEWGHMCTAGVKASMVNTVLQMILSCYAIG